MKGRKRHTPEQIARRLAEGDEMLNEGAAVAEVARAFGITETTWYRWKQTYGGMKGADVKRLKELEAEHRRGSNWWRIFPLTSTCSGSWPRELLTPNCRRGAPRWLRQPLRGLASDERAGWPARHAPSSGGCRRGPSPASMRPAPRSCRPLPRQIPARALARPTER